MNNKKIILSEILPFIILCFFTIVLLTNNFSSSVKNGLSLYACVVLPSVFPFFFITAYFSRLNVTNFLLYKSSPFFNKVFKISGSGGFAMIIGLIAGYPSSTKIIADLCDSNIMDRHEAERTCCIASNPSPAFCILTLGGIIFGDRLFGAKVYLVCALSSILVGLIFTRKNKRENIINNGFNIKRTSGVIYDSAFSAFTTALLVGTLITLFCVFTDILALFGFLTPLESIFTRIFHDQNLAKSLTYSIFESSNGLKFLSGSKNSFFCFPIACAVLGLGGLSVIMQSVTFLKKAKIKTARFIFSKIFCAVLCFCLGVLVNLF